MRGVPLLVTLLFLYYGLPSVGMRLDAFTVAIIALSITSGAYIGEIVRAGIQSIDPGQMRAARSLGMTPLQSYRRVIFPQVFAIVYYPFVNQLNWALLNTSLGMIIGARELTGATQAAQSESFRTFEFFIVAAVMYYAISKAVTFASRLAAWRILRRG